MSILIKGMKMPTNCFECKLLDYTDTFKCRVRYESLAKEHGINISRPDWCPLKPVPPHGRLIDYDRIMKEYKEWYKQTESREYENMFYALYRAISDSRTIIQAEEGET